jgi:hypothetical protein
MAAEMRASETRNIENKTLLLNKMNKGESDVSAKEIDKIAGVFWLENEIKKIKI